MKLSKFFLNLFFKLQYLLNLRKYDAIIILLLIILIIFAPVDEQV